MIRRSKAAVPFLAFTSHFLLSILLAGLAAALARFSVYVWLGLSGQVLTPGLLYLVKSHFRDAAGFACACAFTAAGQFGLARLLKRFVAAEPLQWASVCAAALFCAAGFARITQCTFFGIYSLRWLPVELAAFIGGVAALAGPRR